MKYTIQYNPVRKIYMVWKVDTYGAEVVKTFKTEKAAKSYIEKRA